VVVDGGYLVTGKWHFASGSRHCTWLGGHCKVVERDGSLRADAEGNPIDRTMLFKREVPKITDNWRVMGLRGTGSDTYEVTDLFVPDDYTVQRKPLVRFIISPAHMPMRLALPVWRLAFAAAHSMPSSSWRQTKPRQLPHAQCATAM
jgi:alkylation response protein AidB-like acyl-CoA dehydrogenase